MDGGSGWGVVAMVVMAAGAGAAEGAKAMAVKAGAWVGVGGGYNEFWAMGLRGFAWVCV